ncbi:cupin [Mycolicibacterium sediminis]|uniref:LuxR family transcriptional regulator n=1 Tax=Mycolicibacterium sediminis TaxID=1286180 RepID=A0A7I7QS02_9MYCO|nr:cupin [Mycolicibacterium sediminis]BBY29131.1 LuxR family transcriptional regulator [Mycolicibacterium sediminis]
MDTVSLSVLADDQLEAARGARAGRSARTVYGGHEHELRQTLIAVAEGKRLDDHESPGEATLLVLRGRVRVAGSADDADAVECEQGDFLILPLERHNVDALEDSVLLLTVVTGTRPAIPG